jgi:hypothetical protein
MNTCNEMWICKLSFQDSLSFPFSRKCRQNVSEYRIQSRVFCQELTKQHGVTAQKCIFFSKSYFEIFRIFYLPTFDMRLLNKVQKINRECRKLCMSRSPRVSSQSLRSNLASDVQTQIRRLNSVQ